MSSYLYILHSAGLGKYYIGSTDDLEGRLRRHLTMHDGFTGKAKDWVLVHQEEFLTISEAKVRERQIKAWKSSKRISDLISRSSSAGSEHPDL